MGPRVTNWAAALFVLAVAAGLFARFPITEELRRDEAVFAYGGQQLAEGVPPYVSILDPKAPLSTFISGGAVAAGRALGVDDLYAIRLTFFVIACLTVVAIYVTGKELFGSVAAGIAAAVAFVTFKGFAIDALGGPNAKTPGILFAVLATAFLIRRQWFWAGVSASLALLVWQPLAIYAILAIVAALISADGAERWRNAGLTALGMAIPGLATLAYFAFAGAFGELIEGAVLLPTIGRQPATTDLPERVVHIVATIARGYGLGGAVVWIGLGVLVVLIGSRIARLRRQPNALRTDPLVVVLAPPLACVTAMSLLDFQGYPDAYPLLPYAALGISGGVAAVLAHPAWGSVGHYLRPLAAGAEAIAIAATFLWYSEPRPEARALIRQRADAAAAESLLEPGETVRVLGSPAPLVLMGRRNPSRHIYLSAGIDRWVMEHTPGGFDGWIAEFAADPPDMIVIGGWSGDYVAPTRRWLTANYAPLQSGDLKLFVSSTVLDRAMRSPAVGSPAVGSRANGES